MSAPSHRVFSTPELLEAILLHLPLRNLLVSAQRVCRAWHTMIITSPKLQEALFLRAASQGKGHTFNSLLEKAFPPWFAKVMWGFYHLDWNKSAAKTAAYARSDASWRRMFPVQPPISTLHIVKDGNCFGGRLYRKGEITFDIAKGEGLRMGLLYDLVEQFIFHEQPVSDFSVRWPETNKLVHDHGQEKPTAREDADELSFPAPHGTAPWGQGGSYGDIRTEAGSSATLFLKYTGQCSRRSPKPPPQLRSLGYEPVDLSIVLRKCPVPID